MSVVADIDYPVERARAAYRVGLDRHAAARARGGVHRHGFDRDPPHVRRMLDAESAVAEDLVAFTTGREWLSQGDVPDEGGIDVAPNISVRWTPLAHGCLLLHPEDPDYLVGVLVVGNAPRMRVAGWIRVSDGKDVGKWRADVRNPCYFVSQRHLRPITTIGD